MNYHTMFSHGGKIQPHEPVPISEFVTFDGVIQVMLYKENYMKPKDERLTITEMLNNLSISEQYIASRHMDSALIYVNTQEHGQDSTTSQHHEKMKSWF